LEQGLVEVPAGVAKTNQRRLAVIPTNALEWLRIGGDLPPKNLKKRFDRLRKAAGLFHGRKFGRLQTAGWLRNAMRHSAATYAYARSDNAAAVAKNMGHDVAVLLRNYNSIRTPDGQLVTKELAEKFFDIRPPKQPS